MEARATTSMAAAMGIVSRNSFEVRDIADGMGNACQGRLAQQKFAAARRAHSVDVRARAFGMEYTH